MPPETSALDADVILVGGGLANGLIAWRLRQMQPDLRTLVLEAGPTLGGNHTWSFHPTDLAPAQREWIAPLVSHRWTTHSVRFPGFDRQLEGGYASISSARFAAVIGDALSQQVRTRQRVIEVAPTRVRLASGEQLRAGAVIDGRGPRNGTHLALGFQTFVGHEVQTASAHGLKAPILMDATVAQLGGYRFVYVLPLAPDVLLIEDTCYADSEAIDVDALRARIGSYAVAQGWRIARILREEQGVLPIVLGGDASAFWRDARDVPRSGLAAGLFHPTTGYSLPDAVALADAIAASLAHGGVDAARLFAFIETHALARWHATRFYRALNRMLFRAAAPDARWRVMARFYKLPEPLIARFYAGRLTLLDQARILTGKPPVPLIAAYRAVRDRPHVARAMRGERA